ncbi:23S rRNA (guanosine2251-2'-O)-methyltransferase [Alicyclobacillus cycloheptanicus]|uniref:23S rRNA (Guanosine2251-2'-O)-methyltransferase n=2 Tax=Alicyclobacillus cycloheptanicus TaxID=1457 RepID=A0ABT9XJT4_9BACL|nr:23S rRNA (guanosine2251-2'-O)-methyltransferase [Alicyclobacillus cycloheptanicus]
MQRSARKTRPEEKPGRDERRAGGRRGRAGARRDRDEAPAKRGGERGGTRDGAKRGHGLMAARGADRERQEAVVDTPPAEEFVAGRRPVLEALRAGTPINKIVIAQGAEGGSLAEIVGKAKAAGVLLQNAPKAHLTSVAGENHQGVLAYVAPRAYADLEDVIARKTGQAPLIILLDGVTDPHNLGAVVRTAEAAGAQGVVIPKRRSVPLTGTVAKAAAGALEYVPVARVSNLNQAMDRLKKAGYWIVGLAAEGDTPYTEVDYRGSIALVVGSEGQGLSRLVEERCDYLVRLPMHGEVQSLNASVAAGVMLYEIVRQRG